MADTLAKKREKALSKAIVAIQKEHPEADLAGEVLRAVWKLWHHVKPDMEKEERKRKGWDFWFGGMRQLGSIRQTFAVKVLSTVLSCGEAADKLAVYGERLQELTKAGILVHRQESKYNSYAAEDSAIAELYASFKTWQRDEQLDEYIAHLGTYDRLKLELVVEGPIQLVLSLSDDAFLAIIRLPLWLGGREEPDTQDLFHIAHTFRNRLNSDWQSGWLSDLHELAEQTLEKYHKEYFDQLRRFRVLVPTEADRKRFVSAFEAGQYRSQIP